MGRSQVSRVRRPLHRSGLISTLLAFALVLVGAVVAKPAHAVGTTAWQSGHLVVDKAQLISRSDLVLQAPALKPWQSMPLGNGTLGAAVWDADGYTAQLNRYDTFPDLKSAAQLNVPGLEKLTSAPDYQGRLNLYDGTMVESGGGMTATSYVDSDHDRLVLEVTGADPASTQTADLRLWAGRSPTTYADTASATVALAETFSSSYTDTSGAVAAATVAGTSTTASTVDPKTVRLSFSPRADGSFRIVVAVPKYTGGSVATAAATALAGVTTGTSTTFEASHLTWWHHFWSTTASMRIDSADGTGEYMENLRALQEYTTAASQRGSVPATHGATIRLFSPFQDAAEWSQAQFWHYNQRMRTSANLGSGMAAFNAPYFSLYEDRLTTLESWTHDHLKNPSGQPVAGVCVPETMRIDGTGDGSPAYPAEQGCTDSDSYTNRIMSTGPEIAHNIWLQYRFTGDPAVLTAGYPLMKAVAQFYLDYSAPSAPAVDTNLALAGTASQSSNYISSTPASKAIDGNTSGDWYAGSVASTASSSQPWWQVDLGSAQAMDAVKVFGRSDCCPDRLSDVWVFASNSPFDHSLTPAQQASVPGVRWQHVSGQAHLPSVTFSSIGGSARYVMVQLGGSNILSLGEVQVIKYDHNRHIAKAYALEYTGPATDTAPDIAAVHTLLPEVAEAADLQGEPTFATQVRDALGGFVDQPTTTKSGQTVIARAAVGAASGNFQNAELEPVWPWGRYGDDPSTNAVAVATYADTTYGHTGFDWAMDATWAARLGKPDEVRTQLLDGTRRFQTYANGFDHYTGADPSTTTTMYDEWNGVVATTLQEAAVQAYDGTLRIAPAWPSSWDLTGSVMIEGGHKVDVEVRSGQVQMAGIEAGSTEAVQLRNPWPGQQIRIADETAGTSTTTSESMVTLSLVNGHSYRIERTAAPVGDLSFAGVGGTAATTPKTLGGRTLGVSSLTNLARNGSATQSSTYALSGTPEARLAIDGNTDGTWAGGSVSSTSSEAQPWWQVDLGSVADLSAVKLFGRSDACCVTRLSDVWVFASNAPFDHSLTPTQQAAASGVRSEHLTGQAALPVTMFADAVAGKARYLMVQLGGTDILSLAEVQVLGPPQDLAANGTATQSSDYGSSTPASKAIDGNTSGNWYDGSVASTTSSGQPWWQVDLGASKQIAKVKVYGRTDCCADRLTDAWVFASDVSFNTSLTPAQQAAVAGVRSVHVTGQLDSPMQSFDLPGSARYVMVQLAGTNFLTLAEVVVQ